MNKPTATYDIDVATVIEDFEKKDSSAWTASQNLDEFNKELGH